MQKKNILIYVYEYAHLVEAIRFICSVPVPKEIRYHILCGNSFVYSRAQDSLELSNRQCSISCVLANKPFFRGFGTRKTEKVPHVKEDSCRNEGKMLALSHKAIWSILKIFSLCRNVFIFRRAMRRCLEEGNIDLIVMFEDNISYYSDQLLAEGNKKKLPSLVLPYCITSKEELAKSRICSKPNIPQYSVLGRFIEKYIPHYTTPLIGINVIYQQPEFAFVHSFLSRTKHPFILNSGDFSAIGFESTQMRDFYAAQGALGNQEVYITGSIWMDILAKQKDQTASKLSALYAKYSFDPSKELVVTALPPVLMEKVQGRFKSYRQLLCMWFDTLEPLREKYNILAVLHPRIKDFPLTYLNKYDIPIDRGDTATILPLASLYIASVSETIRWAIACGIPVVNFDVYGFHYPYYENACGVATVYTQQEYKDTIYRLASDAKFWQRLAKNQQQDAERFATLDGKSAQSIATVVQKLLEKRS